MIVLNAADLVVIAARTLGISTDAALTCMEIPAAQAALAETEPLSGDLDGYYLFHALRAGLLTALGRASDASEASERALALTANPAERELLTRGLPL